MIFQTSKYDYNIGIRRYAELTAKEIEELRQKNIKELDVTNYDSPYAMGSGVIISAKNIKVNTEYSGLTSKELKENDLLSEDYSFWDSKS